jgi:hypothetical protein
MLIEFLGHMEPDERLEREVFGARLKSPIGLGSGVDPEGIAIGALGRFGVGFVELGPFPVGCASANSFVAAPLVEGADRHLLAAARRRCPPGVALWLRVVAAAKTNALREIDEMLGRIEGLQALSVSLMNDKGQPTGAALPFWRALMTVANNGTSRPFLSTCPSITPRKA